MTGPKCGQYDNNFIQCKLDAKFLISVEYTDIVYYMCHKHSISYEENFNAIRIPLDPRLTVMI